MEIKRINGEIIFKADVDNIKDALEDAVKRGADLRGADLYSANLSGAYLGGADLRGADLFSADLSCANLSCAYLRGANLGGVNLRYANLRDAYLSGAYFSGANLGGANLRGANLRDAYLGGAYLRGADLIGAYLGGADLFSANLRDANLSDAYLGGANLGGANLRGAKNIPYLPISCPSDGAFTGWKKVRGKLIRLLIPADAKRCSATTRKCRCEKAKVVAITSLDEGECYEEVTNCNFVKTIYKVGEMVYSDSYDDNRWNECSHGIHFFINKQDAINY